MLDIDFTEWDNAFTASRQEAEEGPLLPNRWAEFRPHPKQSAYLLSDRRFNITAAGRRSGKTEIGKRRLVAKALSATEYEDGTRFIAAAPTFNQAKRIFWRDLKKLVPPEFVIGRPSESELTIHLYNGYDIVVTGLDVPERVEGSPLAHIVVTEFANVLERAWRENIRPALSDTQGTADLEGVPEGRNHFYDMVKDAQADQTGEWQYHHWTSEEVLPLYLGVLAAQRELNSAKTKLDELTYAQEYLADFVTFAGRIYYAFSDENLRRMEYRPGMDLVFCFDFNVDPGVAVVCQEQPDGSTGVIGEVHIEQSSNTVRVCNKLIADWGHHNGPIYCFGDATGGSRGSAKVQGTDWDLIKQTLKTKFTDVRYRVPNENPRERARVNAVNSRLKSVDGGRHLFVDPRCLNVVKDFEGVTVIKGSNGEIDKSNKKLTHLTDALGYYVVNKFPTVGGYKATVEQY